MLDFMGIPDNVINLDADIEARKKRWMLKNEIEEWTDDLTEETNNYPDNSEALLTHIKSKYGEVPADRFKIVDINASGTQEETN